MMRELFLADVLMQISDLLEFQTRILQEIHGRDARATTSYFGWIRKVKLQMPTFSSGWTMVRWSRGISRPETSVGFLPLGVSQ